MMMKNDVHVYDDRYGQNAFRENELVILLEKRLEKCSMQQGTYEEQIGINSQYWF